MILKVNMKKQKRILCFIAVFYLVLFLGVGIFYLLNPFKNECVSGDCSNGYGVYKFHSGLKYEGEWKDGKRHGKGKLIYPEIYTYTGEWSNNKMDGHGTMVYYWYKYIGEWKGGKRNGKGTYWFFGKKYEGYWENNLMHGQGTLTYPGGFKWIGEWKKNRIHSGKGTIVAYDSVYNGNRYEGQAKNGRLYGKVKITYPDGSIFTGELISGQGYLQGTIIYPDGKKSNKILEKDDYLFYEL